MRTVLALAVLCAGAAAQESADPRKAEILGKLNNLRITLDFREAPLEDVVSYLHEFSGVNFYIDPDVRAKLADEKLRVTIKVKDLLLKSTLKLILLPRDLTAVYRSGVIVIEHKEKTMAATVLAIYDVRDLLHKIQDFPGPTVELLNGSQGGTGLTGAMFVLDAQAAPAMTEDFVVDLIKSSTGERSWDENPKASISLSNGLLIVAQTRKVHEEVQRLLAQLRQFK